MSPAEIILREAEKLPWDEWQCIVKAMEFVHRKRADKLTLDDSEKTHEELMFHVEHYLERSFVWNNESLPTSCTRQ